MANILAFDTATNACSAALAFEGRQLARFELAPRQHAKLLLPMIQSLLDDAGLALTELDAIAFGSGPGSFMGIRLAVGMAQGLAFGAKIPVIPISTLQVLAQTVSGQAKATRILAGWDARMNSIYWGEYVLDASGVMQLVREDTLSDPESIDINPNYDYILVGNAWSVYAEQIKQTIFDQSTHQYVGNYPEAQAMLAIALSKNKRGQIISPEAARPNYLRDQVVHI